ncbi:MAG: hypothetical protein LC115_08215 [Bacteroidia bacterium]|nr:hypothetical protein [Chitinophagaceae bacterium]MCZ2356656.1 hypothetical protein [Bacteroidia bacterium]
MADWQTERAALVGNLLAKFSGYKEIDKDVTSTGQIPIVQKEKYLRCELMAGNVDDLTSGMVLGRYTVKVTLYLIVQKFDYETFKSDILKNLNIILNTYNYNLIDGVSFTAVENRQAEASFTLEVGASS